jgi:hypothetical protein
VVQGGNANLAAKGSERGREINLVFSSVIKTNINQAKSASVFT